MGRLPALVLIPLLCGQLAANIQASGEAPGSTSSPLKALPAIRTPGLLRRLNQQVTVEGYFYDGSIPMLVDDFEKIRINSILSTDSYLPLVGRKLNLKWGDRVKVSGILEAGTAPLTRESAVLRLTASSRVQVIQVSPLK